MNGGMGILYGNQNTREVFMGKITEYFRLFIFRPYFFLGKISTPSFLETSHFPFHPFITLTLRW
jgi:hypothetical protein